MAEVTAGGVVERDFFPNNFVLLLSIQNVYFLKIK